MASPVFRSNVVVLLLMTRCLLLLPLFRGRGFCLGSVFFILLYSFVFSMILMGKRVLAALLQLCSWWFVSASVLWLFLVVPRIRLQCMNMIVPDHTLCS